MWEAAAAFGHQINYLARGLLANRSRLVGFSDPRRLARKVVSILDWRLADPDLPPISVYFPVELVVREQSERAGREVAPHAGVFRTDDAKALHEAGFSNRVPVSRPHVLAQYWRGGRDPLPHLVQWIADRLIDTIIG